jgi:hypothetical protein
MQARLNSLQRQHQELEDEITGLRTDKSSNSLDVWTLKRKKLALKEQIEALRRKFSAAVPSAE